MNWNNPKSSWDPKGFSIHLKHVLWDPSPANTEGKKTTIEPLKSWATHGKSVEYDKTSLRWKQAGEGMGGTQSVQTLKVHTAEIFGI